MSFIAGPPIAPVVEIFNGAVGVVNVVVQCTGEDSGVDGGNDQPGTGQPDFRLPRYMGQRIH